MKFISNPTRICSSDSSIRKRVSFERSRIDDQPDRRGVPVLAEQVTFEQAIEEDFDPGARASAGFDIEETDADWERVGRSGEKKVAHDESTEEL